MRRVITTERPCRRYRSRRSGGYRTLRASFPNGNSAYVLNYYFKARQIDEKGTSYGETVSTVHSIGVGGVEDTEHCEKVTELKI